MIAKNFPRIFSISTVGIRNHYNMDYVLHPFRTDFAGDSGVGKSIIADILQLILVGERYYESATEASSVRYARDLILSRYGYVLINIEVAKQKYVSIGMYISSVSIDPFIIQQGYDLDKTGAFSNPVSCRDFMKEDQIVSKESLQKYIEKQRDVYCAFVSLREYHEWLMKNEILPIDIHNEGDIKNYARILRAFSRGKGFKNDPEWLKSFFFNDGKEKEILVNFENSLAEIATDLRDHIKNRESVQLLKRKYTLFKNLLELKEKKEIAKELWLRTKIIFHYRNERELWEKLKIKREEKKTILLELFHLNILWLTQKKNKREDQLQLLQKYREQFKEIEQVRNEYDALVKYIEQIYPDFNEIYKHILQVDVLLKRYNNFDEIRTRFQEQAVNHEEKMKLKCFLHRIKTQNLDGALTDLTCVRDVDSYQNCLEELKAERGKLLALQQFMDITNPESLAYWILKNRPNLTFEEESILGSLCGTLVIKPLEFSVGTRYVPDPDCFFKKIRVVEKESDGFWIDWGGVREYIAYVSERFFNTDNKEEIRQFFEKNNIVAKNKIVQLEQKIERLKKLYGIISEFGNGIVQLYERKEQIMKFEEDPELDKTEKELEVLLKDYWNEGDVKLLHEKQERLQGLRSNEENIFRRILTKFSSWGYELDEITLIQFSSIETDLLKKKKIQEQQLEWWNRWLQKLLSITRLKEDKTEYGLIEDTMLVYRKESKNALRREESHLYKEFCIEKDAYCKALIEYETHCFQAFDLSSVNLEAEIQSPGELETQYKTVCSIYQTNYQNIVEEFVGESRKILFRDSDDYLLLAREVVQEEFARRMINGEGDLLDSVQEHLSELAERHIELSVQKFNILKAIFEEVRFEFNEYWDNLMDIGHFFHGDGRQISQGFKLRVTPDYSKVYSIEWIDEFISKISSAKENEAMSQGLFQKVGEKVDIREMMRSAYEQFGGVAKDMKPEDLLNPKKYLDIHFDMRSDDGERNVGSSGQTYAVTALLCIARLSLISGSASRQQQRKGLRFMPIDEAEGIGSNFDMLERIAKTNDYQIITMSVKPLDDFREGEQYLYILNSSKRKGERIRTFAIFSEEEDLKEYNG